MSHLISNNKCNVLVEHKKTLVDGINFLIKYSYDAKKTAVIFYTHVH